MPTFQDFKADSIDGTGNLIPRLKDQVVLAVNVASRCGLTPQYAGLEQLQQSLGGRGFTVLGLPCNQFGGQEPGSEAEIQAFCQTTYDVHFPLTRKIDVNGANRDPLYQWLTDPANGFPGDVEWNFEKFLIDRTGRVVGRYPPATRPDDKGLLADIAGLL
jgi:glutathione peroxidase